MASAMDSLFEGKKKNEKPQGDAMNTLMGGPGGTLSTADLIKAREEYNRYAAEADTGGGDRLTFEEWVRSEWKPANNK